MVIGHTKIINELNNIVNNKNINHSYIFSGPKGIGKNKIAIEFAKKILCENDIERILFDNNNHPDFKYITADEKDNIKIEVIRDMIKDISIKPIRSQYKVYIIDEAEKMTVQTQNALLKTMEEPPEYAVIILVTSMYYSLLDTIRSRGQNIVFNKLSIDEIIMYMRDNDIVINLPKEIVYNLIDGSLTNIEKVKENEDIINKIIEFVNEIQNINAIDLYNFSKELIACKINILDILIYFENILSNVKDVKSSKCIMHIEDGIKNIKGNINFEICIDNMLQKIWEEYNV